MSVFGVCVYIGWRVEATEPASLCTSEGKGKTLCSAARYSPRESDAFGRGKSVVTEEGRSRRKEEATGR